MRNYLVGISGSFSSNLRKISSSCLSCLGCFGSPKNNEMTESQVNTPNNYDRGTNISAEMVFVNQIPQLNEDSDLNKVKSKSNQIVPKELSTISQNDLRRPLESHNLNPETQILELEFKAIEQKDLHSKSEIIGPKTPDLINDDIIKQQSKEIRLLEQLNVLYEMQIKELQAIVNNLTTRIDKLEDFKSQDPKSKIVKTDQPKTLQQEKYPQFLTDQTFASTLPSDWLIVSPRAYSPLLFQNQSTLKDLQDISDKAIQSTSQTESCAQIESSPRVESSSAPQTESSINRNFKKNIFKDIGYKNNESGGREEISEFLKFLNDASNLDFPGIVDKMSEDLKKINTDEIRIVDKMNDVNSSPSSSPHNSSGGSCVTPKVLKTKAVVDESLLVFDYVRC